ncbi:hypothetical protein [Streptomyces sp. NPDC006997]|uniref:hypothetical protein n=1 Tax=Streptomyces sp. NPDC006997 TaxID=3155356 RepID=UPI00340E52D5
MLALRLTRGAHPAVHLRRLLVTAASAGTGFLLLCALGHALSHPENPTASVARLAWCTPPLAATVYLSLAVARTDPGTRPRPGLSAIGLGPARLMLVSATTTALATALGSALALLLYLHLRTGPAAPDFLAPHHLLPLPATLTLLAIVPTTASTATAWSLRPRRESAHLAADGAATSPTRRPASGNAASPRRRPAGRRAAGASPHPELAAQPLPVTAGRRAPWGDGGPPRSSEAESPGEAGRWGYPLSEEPGGGTPPAPGSATHPHAPAPDAPVTPAHPNPVAALPWGIATLAAGLAVETYASSRTATPVHLPGGLTASPTTLLTGWLLTAVGLALTGPGLTHLTGRLLQAARPGALRLLAGRILMTEAPRIGRPLGVVCAVASAAYATAALYDPAATPFGPLTTLGALLVAACTVATLLTAAVETRQARADTNAALLRLGAPATTLRTAAALRTAALLAVFAPLTLLVAVLATQPLQAA